MFMTMGELIEQVHKSPKTKDMSIPFRDWINLRDFHYGPSETWNDELGPYFLVGDTRIRRQ